MKRWNQPGRTFSKIFLRCDAGEDQKFQLQPLVASQLDKDAGELDLNSKDYLSKTERYTTNEREVLPR